jgi:hypothetical protein
MKTLIRQYTPFFCIARRLFTAFSLLYRCPKISEKFSNTSTIWMGLVEFLEIAKLIPKTKGETWSGICWNFINILVLCKINQRRSSFYFNRHGRQLYNIDELTKLMSSYAFSIFRFFEKNPIFICKPMILFFLKSKKIENRKINSTTRKKKRRF